EMVRMPVGFHGQRRLGQCDLWLACRRPQLPDVSSLGSGPDAIFPTGPLLAPIDDPSYRQQVAELNRVPAFGSPGQEQNLLLDVGCQTLQAHDLGNPRPSDMPQLG